MTQLRTFDDRAAEILAAICEAIVPGSARVSPVLYIDAVASGWPPEQRASLGGVLSVWAGVVEGGEAFVREQTLTPEFAWLRSLAIEAFYSDWAPKGYDGLRAWEQIGFDHPLATRLNKDFSYLGRLA